MMCDDPTNQHFFKVKDYTELLELKERLLASLCDGKYQDLLIRKDYRDNLGIISHISTQKHIL